MNPFDLSGRVALVTGASRGIGATMARALAAAGADVILHANRTEPADVAAAIAAEHRVKASCLVADKLRYTQILERIPAGRRGEPQDLAGAAVFLASSAANYVHGHVLVVDGGWMGR